MNESRIWLTDTAWSLWSPVRQAASQASSTETEPAPPRWERDLATSAYLAASSPERFGSMADADRSWAMLVRTNVTA